MGLLAIKEWVCDFLYPPPASSSGGFFTPVYHTLSFLYKVVCDASDAVTNTHVPEISLADHRLHEITTISATQPPAALCKDDKCRMTDYFDVWINETSSNVFSQTSRKKLYQKASYSHWYDVFGYIKFWWTEVIKRLCFLANSIYDKIRSNPVVYGDVIEGPEAYFGTEIGQSLDLESENYESFFHFALLYCTLGGICLVVLLLNRKRLKAKSKRRKEDLLASVDTKEIEINVMQKLIKYLGETKGLDENFQKEFETNYFRFRETVESLEEKPVQKEGAQKEQPKPLRTSEQISKLERQCKWYQSQIRALEQQLRELLRNHRAEVKNYFTENRKIQLELGKSHNRLELSHQLHKTEAKHLHQYITQLQGQYKNICEFNTQYLTCQDSLHRLQGTDEEICVKPKSNIIEVLKKLNQGNTNELDAKHVTYQQRLHNVQNNLQATETVFIKPQTSLAKILNKPSSIESCSKNANEKETIVRPELTPQQDRYIVESLKKIKAIYEEVKELKGQVKEFSGSKDNQTYLQLKGVLIERAIELNNVKCEGHSILRKNSKKAWKYINKCRNTLENQVTK